jgi:predicted CopG family antitoxin
LTPARSCRGATRTTVARATSRTEFRIIVRDIGSQCALDPHAWSMHDLCMATKTISIEIDAYELLVREKRDPRESFSRVIRRVLSERPALTAGDLLAAMEAFQGKGAGARRRRERNAAA